MSDSDQREKDKGDELLRRMLKTPPDPHKPGESKTSLKQKPDGAPGKKQPPGGQ